MSGSGGKSFLFVACFTSAVLAQDLLPPSVVPLQSTEDAVTTTTRDIFTEVQLLPFMQLAHGLRSDAITIIDLKTFFIENLYYDGKGPDAHFWVGKGSYPEVNGTLVPAEDGSITPLHAYSGQNVTITLPDSLTMDDIDYLSVWCIKFKHNFGHTYIKKKAPDDSLGVQLQPLKQLAHGLRSGPIIIVDKKTIFVPNLHYDGKGPDAHFWVGKGTEPNPTGILVANENGSSKSLSAYTGQSIYLTLPYGVTIDDVDYFGLWCIQFKQNFGHTTIPKNQTMPKINGNPKYTSENKEIMRVKKCCPINQVLLSTGCGVSNQKFNLTIDVHKHNSTHIDDDPLQNVEFVPFVEAIICDHQKYPLYPNEDKFPLLQNGSLMVLNMQEVLSMDDYCFESVNFENEQNENWETTAILCFSGTVTPLSESFFITYAVGILLSAIFLIITALVFLFIKEVRDTRGKCVIFYSVSMAVAFICLVVAQFSELNKTSCTVVAYIIQFFLVSSFAWLTMISTETLCKILFHDKDAYTQDRKRLCIYITIGIVVPLIISVISLCIDQIPDIPTSVLKPQFGRNACWFDQNKTSMYFYIPIAIAILCNIALGFAMKVKLWQFQKKRRSEIAWITVQEELKPMFRSCVILLALMAVCWVTEMISFFMNSNEGVWIAIDIINSLQGVLVFIIFVAHRPVKNKMCRKKRRIVHNDIVMQQREPVLQNHNNRDSEFLTVLYRADSTELN